ncbi:hypothetical protein [Pimelobacter simplex]|uniref:hypothetical protein n=1 Tax=Nocardioides simplex TaxID=2045 RepID=UPI0013758D4B|nr:hypothetical protein [Pimelobacter simplex]
MSRAVYFDSKPCAVCGSQVELRPRDGGPRAGAVPGAGEHEPDATVDERVCTNPDCPGS